MDSHDDSKKETVTQSQSLIGTEIVTQYSKIISDLYLQAIMHSQTI